MGLFMYPVKRFFYILLTVGKVCFSCSCVFLTTNKICFILTRYICCGLTTSFIFIINTRKDHRQFNNWSIRH